MPGVMAGQSRLRVLALATFPEEAAATRFRLSQYRPPLARRGIDLRVRPMLSATGFSALYDRRRAPATAAALGAGVARRLADAVRASRADVVLVQREAALFGPPVLEWLAAGALRRPLVLDLDDATWIPYDSPTYGRFGRWLKPPGKTDRLIELADAVVCGNRYIERHVEATATATPTLLLPTLVDLGTFRPRSLAVPAAVPAVPAGPPVIGWSGTHSTVPYLVDVAPALVSLAADHRFRLRVVGAGHGWRPPPGLDAEVVPWRRAEEVATLQSFDIGLYPLREDAWAMGKSGFKAIQYLAVGVPYVVSPVGSAADIGVAGTTHLEAHDAEEWRMSMSSLLENADLRQEMGRAGRAHAEAHFALEPAVEALSALLYRVAAR